MKADGVNVIEMQMLLLKKVEELTLHIIDLENRKNNEIQELKTELSILKNQIN